MKKYELEDNDENIKNSISFDILEKNNKLINFMKFVNNMQENYTISVDGSWGCGKTFFIKQLMYLRNNSIIVTNLDEKSKQIIDDFRSKYYIVYYNAWENDDHNDPLESLIFNILNTLPNYSDTFIDGSETFELVKKSLINFIEVSSLGIIKSDDIKEMKTFSKLAESVNTIEEKKKALFDLLSVLSKHKRILLIIDELDRCKPDYAVKMIETIKHFYINKNITSVVVTNNNQLSKTIKKFYGNEFDGYSYLNKIYDAVITLQSDNIEKYAQTYLGINKSTNLPEDMTMFLFRHYLFSYRECNKYMSMYRLVLPYIHYEYKFHPNSFIDESCVFLPLSICLKIKDIYMYEDFINGKGEDILKQLFNTSQMQNENKELYEWLCEIFKVEKDKELIDSVLINYKKIFIKGGYKFDKYPFLEAVSMVGNLINVD